MLLGNEARVGINTSVRSYDRIMFIFDWTILLINLKKGNFKLFPQTRKYTNILKLVLPHDLKKEKKMFYLIILRIARYKNRTKRYKPAILTFFPHICHKKKKKR